MEEAEIRREYFRRFRIAVFMSAGLFAVTILLFLAWMMPRPWIGLWVALVVMTAILAVGYLWYHQRKHQDRAIFSRREKTNRSIIDPEAFFTFVFLLVMSIVSHLVRGRKVEWLEQIYVLCMIAVVVGIPELWFRKWRRETLNQLPEHSPLIERSS